MTDGPLLTVREKVDPRSTALVVIDYQNDFVAARGAFARTGFDAAPLQRIAPALRSILTAARAARVVVPAECVATYDKAAHQAALANIDLLFGHVTSLREVQECWRRRS